MDLLAQRPLHGQEAKLNKRQFLGAAWTIVIVCCLFMILKLFARWHSFKKLFWDDFCVIFAWILVLLTVIDWQIIIDDMLQWQALISGRLWPPPPTIIRTGERYYIGSIIALVLFFTSLWAVKISFLLFFRRLGRNVEGQSIIWWLVFTVTFSSYFVCIGLIQYSCLGSPVLELIKKPSLEIIEKCSKPGPVKFGQISVKTCGALDVVTDYMIMAIPIKLLWGVQMSVRRKIAVRGIFSLGIITTVVAIVRMLSIISRGRWTDTSWAYLWNLIEQGIAIIIACVSSSRSLFHRQASPARDANVPRTIGSKNIFRQRDRRKSGTIGRLYDTLTGLTQLSAMTTTNRNLTEPESDNRSSSTTELSSFRCSPVDQNIPSQVILVQTDYQVQREE